MIRRLLGVLAVGLVLNAAAAQDESVEKELAKFQGTWKVLKYEAADKQPPPDDLREKTRFVFKGDKLRITVDGKADDETTIIIEPKKKPRAITMVGTRGRNKGKLAPGIYEFDGDTLRICAAAPGQKRPEEFKSVSGSKTAVLTLQREKE
jgi:uncharacterized protein (TIGR03067 family)